MIITIMIRIENKLKKQYPAEELLSRSSDLSAHDQPKILTFGKSRSAEVVMTTTMATVKITMLKMITPLLRNFGLIITIMIRNENEHTSRILRRNFVPTTAMVRVHEPTNIVSLCKSWSS
eukprot:TRINITY_DN17651_c0_g1_i1.p2 TRINITY_DN17651_c0_g1~~TRINITY_DN17651_c0_g1_i1.p2  ORF type:complete len:120 (+),score=8.56 TRINITY_DN17651_c0_g1_i1:210-569(+)